MESVFDNSFFVFYYGLRRWQVNFFQVLFLIVVLFVNTYRFFQLLVMFRDFVSKVQSCLVQVAYQRRIRVFGRGQGFYRFLESFEDKVFFVIRFVNRVGLQVGGYGVQVSVVVDSCFQLIRVWKRFFFLYSRIVEAVGRFER